MIQGPEFGQSSSKIETSTSLQEQGGDSVIEQKSDPEKVKEDVGKMTGVGGEFIGENLDSIEDEQTRTDIRRILEKAEKNL